MRSILVHAKPPAPEQPASGPPDMDAHIDVAIDLAAKHGARLAALHTERHSAILALLQGEVHPAVVRRREEAARESEALRKRLHARAEAAGVALEWLHGEGDAAELLGYAGRAHDLVVLEQTDLATDDIGFDVPERAIAVAGRPVLIVPNRGQFETPGRNIVIAWNSSREAALAVQGAADFLRQADQVTVLAGRPRDRLPSVTRLPSFDLASRLGSASRPARIETLDTTDGEAGAAILQACARLGADMLVMGAYGRSWFREWVLGGATLHVLRNMRLPVLMAH